MPAPRGPWKLTFSEEFAGPLDPAHWLIPNGTPDTSYPDYPNAVYAAANIAAANGVGRLSVSQTPTGFATCSMTSVFQQAYGYWEARVRCPQNAPGIACSFWLDASGWAFPEIDILEWLGYEPDVNHTTWHYAVPNDGTNAVGISSAWADLTLDSEWRTVGMLWTPEEICWSIDNVRTEQRTRTRVNVNSDNAPPLQTIFTATVGGWGLNKVAPATQFPAVFEIDYLRIYSDDPQ